MKMYAKTKELGPGTLPRSANAHITLHGGKLNRIRSFCGILCDKIIFFLMTLLSHSSTERVSVWHSNASFEVSQFYKTQISVGFIVCIEVSELIYAHLHYPCMNLVSANR